MKQLAAFRSKLFTLGLVVTVLAVFALALLPSFPPAGAAVVGGGIVRADGSVANVYASFGLVSVFGQREQFAFFSRGSADGAGNTVYVGTTAYRDRLAGATIFSCSVSLTEYPASATTPKSVSWTVTAPGGAIVEQQDKIPLVGQ